MGYLSDFRKSFAKRLEGLSPEEMQEALNVACNALLESYRNGQKSRAQHKDSTGTRPEECRQATQSA